MRARSNPRSRIWGAHSRFLVKKFEVTDADIGSRLDKIVVAQLGGLGRAGVKKLFEQGRVRVLRAGHTRPQKASKGETASQGDVIEVDFEEAASGGTVPDADAPLSIVLERDDLVVIDKPAGQPSAPIDPGERGTVANAVLARYPETKAIGFSAREPGLVHRLDTDTSGLLLVARTLLAFETLSRALKEGRIDKRYHLLCKGGDLPESGTIEIPLAPHPKDRRRVYACVHPRDVARYSPRPAITHYVRRLACGDLWLVEARAAKASRHQIRAHFAAIGHPLAGDALYGGPEVDGLTRHALHAASIVWGGDASVPAFHAISPLPDDIRRIVES
ncbi:MAG: RluA family pseudouridine synthase [Polyangiaceae bacterium]|nr:RluA family pseudouridine synthase [Polyangiaceae bacterium]